MKIKSLLKTLSREDPEAEVVIFDPDTRLVYEWDGNTELELKGRTVISLIVGNMIEKLPR